MSSVGSSWGKVGTGGIGDIRDGMTMDAVESIGIGGVAGVIKGGGRGVVAGSTTTGSQNPI